MRRFLAAALALLTASGALVACSTDSGATDFSPIQVEVSSQDEVRIEPGEMTAQAVAEIDQLSGFGDFVVGAATEIKLAGELPADGAVLSKTYAAAVPEGASATFAFWDDEYEVWTAVPSELSADRRTLTAIVHHFSLWNDIIAGSNEAISGFVDQVKTGGQQVANWAGQKTAEFGDALHWGLGNLFSTRVELPVCDNPSPSWVTTLNVNNDVGNSVRFCVGHDASDPELLVVKARANRGYGFPVNLEVAAQWESNSTTGDASLAGIINLVGGVDKTIGETIGGLFNQGRYVGPGKEISFGISSEAFEDFERERFIDLPAPTSSQFTLSLLTSALVADSFDSLTGTVAAAISIASCANSFNNVTNVGQAGGAVLKCVSAQSGPIASLLGEAFLASGMQPAAAGKLAGKAVGKIGLALALFDALLMTGDYMLDQLDVAGDRFLTIDVALPEGDVVPGFPSELQGEWCVEAPNQGECFALSAVIINSPNIKLTSSSPSTSVPGATDYVLCYAPEFGDPCGTAMSLYLRYFPAGVEWDCPSMNGFDMACGPSDQSEEHDTSRARLVTLANHQQDSTYYDSAPMYEQ